ncbi:hypothetical protein BASA50_009493 [Batrachochytrium salamandrivorans]|uniref:Mid2 domain-containing protein n=1 Tax=Batrachochytrium salamandrivorans TaxID=1357716 RepID=A0ABQ8F139_9FUNG|nr:hypothetical protein BASA62_009854 [Batrachochytrium salamandrivorans]KAH6590231.1 hypothetical protein BASA50_009493 [Batrachochytrium salamandrivorans]KAH6602568.1 hypothetical protein BASA61_001025 [Batrachochytrium salamandrivorans]KAH9275165.1 hypothetical protein BASA83_002389 [Batrachochytrium salamandrivorans]
MVQVVTLLLAASFQIALVTAAVCSVTDRLCIDQQDIIMGQTFPVWYAANQIPTTTPLSQLILTMYQGDLRSVADPCHISLPIAMTFQSPLTPGSLDPAGFAASFMVSIPLLNELITAQSADNRFFFQLRDPNYRVCLTGPYQDGGLFTFATLVFAPALPSSPLASPQSGEPSPAASSSPISVGSPGSSPTNNDNSGPRHGPQTDDPSSRIDSLSSAAIGGIVAAAALIILLVVFGGFIYRRYYSDPKRLINDEGVERLAPLDVRRHSSVSLFSCASTESFINGNGTAMPGAPRNMQYISPVHPSKSSDTLRPVVGPTLAQTAAGDSVEGTPFTTVNATPPRPLISPILHTHSETPPKLSIPLPSPGSLVASGVSNSSIGEGKAFSKLSSVPGFSSAEARIIADAFRQELIDPSLDWEAHSESTCPSPSRGSSIISHRSNLSYSGSILNPFGTGSRPINKSDGDQ